MQVFFEAAVSTIMNLQAKTIQKTETTNSKSICGTAFAFSRLSSMECLYVRGICFEN